MKTVLSMGMTTLILFVTMPSSWADTVKKDMRNDRISMTKPIAQYDINPFSDQQRVVRNDRVNYTVSNVEKPSTDKKRRIIRNDRVSISR